MEPFGDVRADFRNAIVCDTIVKALGGKSKVANYMPEFDVDPEEQGDNVLKSEKRMAQLYGNHS